ncbi:hypothetical protein EZS27_034440 [termite gut metagenome]|uniref:Uncharacterized protein n=1 Tax=termite gut metagenome TaxID=433724 RepID=A0A5J4Q1U2_9ZZZZ
MYQLSYQLPNSKEIKNQILNMDEQQRELYQLVKNGGALAGDDFLGVPLTKTGE